MPDQIILLNYKTKTTRLVNAGEPYRKDPYETIVGRKRDEEEMKLIEEAESAGFQWGDLVQKAVKLIPEAIRPTHCTKCEERRLALNHIKQNGVLDTIKRLKEINDA